jgi:hypothetical protein
MKIQKLLQESTGRLYIETLNIALLKHQADHNLRKVEWVKSGEEVMKLLRDRYKMPDGMTYANDTWTVRLCNLRWAFKKASDTAPPRIEAIH